MPELPRFRDRSELAVYSIDMSIDNNRLVLSNVKYVDWEASCYEQEVAHNEGNKSPS